MTRDNNAPPVEESVTVHTTFKIGLFDNACNHDIKSTHPFLKIFLNSKYGVIGNTIKKIIILCFFWRLNRH